MVKCWTKGKVQDLISCLWEKKHNFHLNSKCENHCEPDNNFHWIQMLMFLSACSSCCWWLMETTRRHEVSSGRERDLLPSVTSDLSPLTTLWRSCRVAACVRYPAAPVSSPATPDACSDPHVEGNTCRTDSWSRQFDSVTLTWEIYSVDLNSSIYVGYFLQRCQFITDIHWTGR